MTDWTLGRGLAIAGKWICIAIMFAALLNFIDNQINPDDCYCDRPVVPTPPEKAVGEIPLTNNTVEWDGGGG